MTAGGNIVERRFMRAFVGVPKPPSKDNCPRVEPCEKGFGCCKAENTAGVFDKQDGVAVKLFAFDPGLPPLDPMTIQLFVSEGNAQVIRPLVNDKQFGGLVIIFPKQVATTAGSIRIEASNGFFCNFPLCIVWSPFEGQSKGVK